MQTLSIIGNLGADAVVREANGQKFVSFKVADTQKFTDQKGNERETTTWISCALSGDGGKLLPYLKAGVKVFVMGRPSYRIYSSERDRQMKAGVDLHVISIELAGGSSDDVPRRLVDPSTGSLVDVSKWYWVQGFANCQLVGVRGGVYNVDAQGFVKPAAGPAANDASVVEAAAQSNEASPGENVEVFGEQSKEAQQIAAKSSKKK